MVRKSIAITLLFLFTLSMIYSNINLAEKGFKNVTSIEKENIISYSMTDTKGHLVRLAVANGTNDEQITSFTTIHSMISSWTIIDFSSITYIIDPSSIAFSVNPTSITYKEVNLLPYVPSGLYFTKRGDILQYDFRMNTDNGSPKINGIYYAERALLEAMLNLLNVEIIPKENTPIETVTKEEVPDLPSDIDVQILEFKVEALEKQVEFLDTTKAVKGEVEILSKSVLQSEKDRDEKEKQLLDEIDLLKKEIASMTLTLNSVKDSLNDLKEKQNSTEEELSDLRKAIITLHNIGVFGNIHTIDPSIIERIITLKQKNPELTQMEAKKLLARDKFAPTDQELFTIFAVYFNEYQ